MTSPSIADAEVLHESERVGPAIFGGRQLACVLGLVAVADMTLYNGQGFAGIGCLLTVAAAILQWGIGRSVSHRATVLMFALLLLISVRLWWQGTTFLVVSGFMVLSAVILAYHGQIPHVLRALVYFPLLSIQGLLALGDHMQVRQTPITGPQNQSLIWALPLIVCLCFALIFGMANPETAQQLRSLGNQAWRHAMDWVQQISAGQLIFWGLVSWFGMGALRSPATWFQDRLAKAPGPWESEASPLFAPWRNTLLAVIGLFTIYLAIEFYTLWNREFPPGFYYAGYAHEGAAWLTVALILATIVLSIIFRGTLLRDPRLSTLRKLSWIWSAFNVLLALAVYHRLLIYVDFNGMTRMRTIGFFGITCVVVGFGWVLWKIHRNQTFRWLVQRQLGTLALAILIYGLTPVDPWIHGYNASRILHGDLAPAVQITEHPVSNEGLLILPRLIDSANPIIRDGIRAMLSARQDKLREDVKRQEAQGWTAYQQSEHTALEHLDSLQAYWLEFAKDSVKRELAYKTFKDFVFQWY